MKNWKITQQSTTSNKNKTEVSFYYINATLPILSAHPYPYAQLYSSSQSFCSQPKGSCRQISEALSWTDLVTFKKKGVQGKQKQNNVSVCVIVAPWRQSGYFWLPCGARNSLGRTVGQNWSDFDIIHHYACNLNTK